MAKAEKKVIMMTGMTAISTQARRDPETTTLLLKDPTKIENETIVKIEREATVMILTVITEPGLITITNLKTTGVEDIILFLNMKKSQV